MFHSGVMKHISKQVRTSAELRRDGTSSGEITRKVRQGVLHRVAPNAYIPGDLWGELEAKDRARVMHLALMKTHSGYVLSHVSAALWWGAPLLRLPDEVWVSHASGTVRSKPGWRVARARGAECGRAVMRDGLLVTDAFQTALDCARVLPPMEALCVVDFFLHTGLVPYEEFYSFLVGSKGRHSRRLRWVAEAMSDKAESPAESLARFRILEWGFVRPREQVTVWAGGRAYRPDFLWPEVRVILEVDGKVKYTGAYGDGMEVAYRELGRQRELEAAGYRVVRARWKDLMYEPQKVQAQLWAHGVPMQ